MGKRLVWENCRGRGGTEGNRKMELEVKSDGKKPRKKSLRLWDSFYLSLILCLPQLNLKLYFAGKQF